MKHDIDRLYSAIELLREHMDRGFAEVRASQEANMKLQLRLWLAVVAIVASMAGKIFGLY